MNLLNSPRINRHKIKIIENSMYAQLFHRLPYFAGNKDRHSFSLFKEWGNYSFPIMYDNGRG